MGRFGQSVFYSFIVTLYFMCFYYAFGVAQTLFQGGDLVKFFFDTLIVGTVVWGFLTFLFYELAGSFERLNQRRRDDDDKSNDGKGPKDGSGPSNGSGNDSGADKSSGPTNSDTKNGGGQGPSAGK